MTFYIVRHADKEWGNHYNPKLRHQDELISQMGKEQAEKLVTYFGDKEIPRIYNQRLYTDGANRRAAGRTPEPATDYRRVPERNRQRPVRRTYDRRD